MTATHAPAATSAPQVRFNLLEHLSGRMRLVPVLASLVLVWAFFWTQQPAFLSPRNLTNLAMQMVVVATLAGTRGCSTRGGGACANRAGRG